MELLQSFCSNAINNDIIGYKLTSDHHVDHLLLVFFIVVLLLLKISYLMQTICTVTFITVRLIPSHMCTIHLFDLYIASPLSNAINPNASI